MLNPFESSSNEQLREIYNKTEILRKPITGIVSGYHQLPYFLIAPDDENESNTVRVTGKINVSPKFIISPQALGDHFADVFDPETFDDELQGRLFSFAYHRKKNYKIESDEFEIKNCAEKPREHLDRLHDDLLRKEDVGTALVFCPKFDFYPISVDRFVNEIVDREFQV